MIDVLQTGRALTVWFQRNDARDQQEEKVRFSGYDILWPDGTPVTVGLDRFCQLGVRTLFGRRLISKNLLTMYLLPIPDIEAPLLKLPRGLRSRRFYVRRNGDEGRVMLLDGTPTELVFHRKHDDERVVWWVGLDALEEAAEQWFDIVVLPRDSEESTGSVLQPPVKES